MDKNQPTEYLSKYWTELHKIFNFARSMYADYAIDISFVVA